MKKCPKCGYQNEDEDRFCMKCGMALGKSSGQDLKSDLSAAGQDAASKIASGAKNIVQELRNVVDEQKAKATKEVEEEVEKQKARNRRPVRPDNISGSKYMSKTALWSHEDYRRRSERQRYYTNEVTQLKIIDFIKKVNEKIKANGVPAAIKVKKVFWDGNAESQGVCYVEPRTKDVNPFTYIIRYEPIGKFTYVEEKTYITPPDLPPKPMQPLDFNQPMLKYKILAFIVGLIMAILDGMLFLAVRDELAYIDNGASMLLFFLLLSIAACCWGYTGILKSRAIRKHNLLCAKQEQEYRAAWQNWHNACYKYAYQEEIDGHLNRIYDAVTECIKQVGKEEFKNAVVNEKEEEASHMAELEELIRRGKEDYR